MELSLSERPSEDCKRHVVSAHDLLLCRDIEYKLSPHMLAVLFDTLCASENTSTAVEQHSVPSRNEFEQNSELLPQFLSSKALSTVSLGDASKGLFCALAKAYLPVDSVNELDDILAFLRGCIVGAPHSIKIIPVSGSCHIPSVSHWKPYLQSNSNGELVIEEECDFRVTDEHNDDYSLRLSTAYKISKSKKGKTLFTISASKVVVTLLDRDGNIPAGTKRNKCSWDKPEKSIQKFYVDTSVPQRENLFSGLSVWRLQSKNKSFLSRRVLDGIQSNERLVSRLLCTLLGVQGSKLHSECVGVLVQDLSTASKSDKSAYSVRYQILISKGDGDPAFGVVMSYEVRGDGIGETVLNGVSVSLAGPRACGSAQYTEFIQGGSSAQDKYKTVNMSFTALCSPSLLEDTRGLLAAGGRKHSFGNAEGTVSSTSVFDQPSECVQNVGGGLCRQFITMEKHLLDSDFCEDAEDMTLTLRKNPNLSCAENYIVSVSDLLLSRDGLFRRCPHKFAVQFDKWCSDRAGRFSTNHAAMPRHDEIEGDPKTLARFLTARAWETAELYETDEGLLHALAHANLSPDFQGELEDVKRFIKACFTSDPPEIDIAPLEDTFRIAQISQKRQFGRKKGPTHSLEVVEQCDFAILEKYAASGKQSVGNVRLTVKYIVKKSKKAGLLHSLKIENVVVALVPSADCNNLPNKNGQKCTWNPGKKLSKFYVDTSMRLPDHTNSGERCKIWNMQQHNSAYLSRRVFAGVKKNEEVGVCLLSALFSKPQYKLRLLHGRKKVCRTTLGNKGTSFGVTFRAMVFTDNGSLVCGAMVSYYITWTKTQVDLCVNSVSLAKLEDPSCTNKYTSFLYGRWESWWNIHKQDLTVALPGLDLMEDIKRFFEANPGAGSYAGIRILKPDQGAQELLQSIQNCTNGVLHSGGVQTETISMLVLGVVIMPRDSAIAGGLSLDNTYVTHDALIEIGERSADPHQLEEHFVYKLNSRCGAVGVHACASYTVGDYGLSADKVTAVLRNMKVGLRIVDSCYTVGGRGSPRPVLSESLFFWCDLQDVKVSVDCTKFRESISRKQFCQYEGAKNLVGLNSAYKAHDMRTSVDEHIRSILLPALKTYFKHLETNRTLITRITGTPLAKHVDVSSLTVMLRDDKVIVAGKCGSSRDLSGHKYEFFGHVAHAEHNNNQAKERIDTLGKLREKLNTNMGISALEAIVSMSDLESRDFVQFLMEKISDTMLCKPCPIHIVDQGLHVDITHGSTTNGPLWKITLTHHALLYPMAWWAESENCIHCAIGCTVSVIRDETVTECVELSDVVVALKSSSKRTLGCGDISAVSVPGYGFTSTKICSGVRLRFSQRDILSSIIGVYNGTYSYALTHSSSIGSGSVEQNPGGVTNMGELLGACVDSFVMLHGAGQIFDQDVTSYNEVLGLSALWSGRSGTNVLMSRVVATCLVLGANCNAFSSFIVSALSGLGTTNIENILLRLHSHDGIVDPSLVVGTAAPGVTIMRALKIDFTERSSGTKYSTVLVILGVMRALTSGDMVHVSLHNVKICSYTGSDLSLLTQHGGSGGVSVPQELLKSLCLVTDLSKAKAGLSVNFSSFSSVVNAYAAETSGTRCNELSGAVTQEIGPYAAAADASGNALSKNRDGQAVGDNGSDELFVSEFSEHGITNQSKIKYVMWSLASVAVGNGIPKYNIAESNRCSLHTSYAKLSADMLWVSHNMYVKTPHDPIPLVLRLEYRVERAKVENKVGETSYTVLGGSFMVESTTTDQQPTRLRIEKRVPISEKAWKILVQEHEVFVGNANRRQFSFLGDVWSPLYSIVTLVVHCVVWLLVKVCSALLWLLIELKRVGFAACYGGTYLVAEQSKVGTRYEKGDISNAKTDNISTSSYSDFVLQDAASGGTKEGTVTCAQVKSSPPIEANTVVCENDQNCLRGFHTHDSQRSTAACGTDTQARCNLPGGGYGAATQKAPVTQQDCGIVRTQLTVNVPSMNITDVTALNNQFGRSGAQVPISPGGGRTFVPNNTKFSPAVAPKKPIQVYVRRILRMSDATIEQVANPRPCGDLFQPTRRYM